ncbi:hypothetical protein [Paenibacillus medicaginis]|uniref:Uncharacterized protein n=1 Tax=Paenibacillus medicaginis TaxID=1470560 RepID=A0ABV5BZI3_9BACL
MESVRYCPTLEPKKALSCIPDEHRSAFLSIYLSAVPGYSFGTLWIGNKRRFMVDKISLLPYDRTGNESAYLSYFTSQVLIFPLAALSIDKESDAIGRYLRRSGAFARKRGLGVLMEYEKNNEGSSEKR